MANQKAKDVFLEAIEHDGDLDAFLSEHCGDDRDLRREVEDLLAAHRKAGGFLGGSVSSTPTASMLPVLEEKVGTKIGAYKLLQQIGEGGFGVVYLAEQSEPVRRKVALKIIKPGMDTKEVIARFEAERQALAMMDHPNIAKVLDGGATESGRPYFVMELVKGIPLTDFCDKNRLNTKDRLQLFASVCKAIQHAHNKGVIHRDIKPSNVMVTLHDGEPVPKVIDFGVAKAITSQLTEKTMFTAYGQMIGTPQYMSPEQAEMSGLDIDTRSDVYSLGVLLYEMLTGTTPLTPDSMRGKAYAEMQRMIRDDEPPRPSIRLSSLGDASASIAANRDSEIDKLGAIVRGELDWIVMKSLEKNRERRYETANGLAADIARYLNDEAVEACPPSVGYVISKLARRHRGLLSVAAAFLLLITLSSVVAWGLLIDARNARQALADSNEELQLERDSAIEAREAADKAREDAIEHQQKAEQERERAVEAESRILNQAYDHGILLAGKAFEEHDLARARRLLDSCPQQHRSWEWHWISRQVDDRYQPMDVPEDDRVFNTFDYSPDDQRMVQLIRNERPTKLVLKDVKTGDEIWRREFGPKVGPAWSPRFVGKSGRFILVDQMDYSNAQEATAESVSNQGSGSRSSNGDHSSVLLEASTGKTIFTADSSMGRLVLNDDESGFRLLRYAQDRLHVERWSLKGNTAELRDSETLKMPDERFARARSGASGPFGGRTSILSENCRRLYLIGRLEPDALVQCWDTQRGVYLWERSIDHEVPRNLPGTVRPKLALDESKGRLLLLVSRQFRLPVMDLQSRYPATAYEVDATSGEVKSSQVCPLPDAKQHSLGMDGQYVASSNAGRTVCVWDPATGKEINRYLSSSSMLFGPRIRAGDLWLPSGRIKVRPTTTRAILSGHKQRVVSLAFDATGKQLISSSSDETVRVWNVDDCSEALCIPVRSPGIARFTSDGRIVHKSADGVQVRSIRDSESSVMLLPSSQELQPLDVGGDDEQVGLLDGYVRRWDLATGELTSSHFQLEDIGNPRRRISGDVRASRRFYSYGISDDCKRAAGIRRRGGLVSYDLESGEAHPIDANLSPDAWRLPPRFKPGSNNVIAMTDLGEIRLLDLDKRQTIARLHSHSRMITHIVFSPDGRRLFSIDREGTLIVWNADNGEQLVQIPKAVENGEPVVAMAVSPDGNTVALADFNEIRLLETQIPTDEQIARRRVVLEASEYVNRCFGQTRFASGVLERIRQNESLAQDVRAEAVRIAKVRGDLTFAAATQMCDEQLDRFVQERKRNNEDYLENLLHTIDEAVWLSPEETMQDRHWRMSKIFFDLALLEQEDPEFDARALFDELLALTPQQASHAMFQAEIAGQKGDWPQAGKALDSALELANSDYRSWLGYAYMRALLYLRIDDVDSYQTLLDQAETRFRSQPIPENALRLAKMCLVSKECPLGLETVEDLFADVDPRKLNGPLAHEHEMVQGLLNYRRGKFDKVAEKLETLGIRPQPRNRGGEFLTMTSARSVYFGPDTLQSAVSRLFLAMATKQQGDDEEATQRLTHADAQTKAMMWQHRLMFDIVRAEAAEVFGQKTTVTPTAYGWSIQVQKPPFDRPVASRTTDEAHSGKASLLIEWAQKGSPKNPRSIGQYLSATPYLGKRIRLTAYAKSQNLRGAAGLWMRVDGSQEGLPFDNMMNRPIRGTTDWQPYSIVLDVPEDATRIALGGQMIGRGRLWLDDFSLEAVDRDVPVTDTGRGQPNMTDEQQARAKEAAKEYHKTVFNGGFEQSQRFIGVGTKVVDGELVVTNVIPASVGESTGLQAGDIIVSVDGTAVSNVTEFIEALHEGERAKEITLRNKDAEKVVKVEFPE